MHQDKAVVSTIWNIRSNKNIFHIQVISLTESKINQK